MENNTTSFESLFEKSKSYISKSIELAKLKAIDRLADVVSSLISNLIVLVFVVLFFVMVNIGVALWIGEMLTKPFYGFFVVAGFYGIIGLILIIFKKSLLKTPISESIITKALK